MNAAQRASSYVKANSKWSPVVLSGRWLTGTWLIGNDYRNPGKMYGSYPRSYLHRVHSMFPDAKSVLHAFSGCLNETDAREAAPSAKEFELVDIRGEEQGCYPTWKGGILRYCKTHYQFDLILADPPYSQADAEKYGTKMPVRRKVMHALRHMCKTGGNLVWLDTMWPMHRRDEWRCWAQIGLVRSTNHRVRLVSIFEAV